MSIDKPNFEAQKIETKENLENFNPKDALANLGNEIFEAGNINRLPFREEQELKYYTENNKQDFINFFENNLLINNLELV